MSLYEVLATFEAFVKRQREKEVGKEVSEEEMEDFLDVLRNIPDHSVMVH